MTTLLRAGRLETDGETAACAGIRKPCIAPSAATPPRNARRRMLISLAMLSSPRLRRGSPFPSPQLTQAYRLIFRSRQRKLCLLDRAKKFSRILRKCVRGSGGRPHGAMDKARQNRAPRAVMACASEREPGPEDFDRIEGQFRIEAALNVVGLPEAKLLARE